MIIGRNDHQIREYNVPLCSMSDLKGLDYIPSAACL